MPRNSLEHQRWKRPASTLSAPRQVGERPNALKPRRACGEKPREPAPTGEPNRANAGACAKISAAAMRTLDRGHFGGHTPQSSRCCSSLKTLTSPEQMAPAARAPYPDAAGWRLCPIVCFTPVARDNVRAKALSLSELASQNDRCDPAIKRDSAHQARRLKPPLECEFDREILESLAGNPELKTRILEYPCKLLANQNPDTRVSGLQIPIWRLDT